MNENRDVLQLSKDPPGPRPSMWRHFKAEFSLSFFELEEGCSGKLDMEKNFCIGKGFFSAAGILKFIFFALSVATIVADLSQYEHSWFFLAYLTRWTSLVSIAYFMASFTLTLRSSSTGANRHMKITWILFSLACTMGVEVSIVYWGAIYDPEWGIKFHNFMTHGGLAFFVVIDGLVLNRTPVRLKHVVVTQLFAILYAIWSIIQNVVLRHNPEDDDDDDAIYDVLKWREETGAAVLTFLVLLLVLLPLLHVIFWALSLRGRHRQEATPTKQEEEGHVPRLSA
jgi:hypothetical protein